MARCCTSSEDGAGRHADASPHQLLPALFLGPRRGRRERHDRDRRQPAVSLERRRHGARPHRVSVYQAFSQGSVRITTTDPGDRSAGRRTHAVRRARPHPHARRRAPPARARLQAGGRAIATRVDYGVDRSLDRRAARSDASWTTGCSPNAPMPSMPAAPAAWAPRRSALGRRSDCRVIGCTGLRVIDASVMPEVVRANTHLTTVMIAEKMADRLKRWAAGIYRGNSAPASR